MKPFEREYVLNKIKEYNRKIKPNKIGEFEIKRIDGLKGIVQGYLYEKKDKINLKIAELNHNYDHTWMRLTPLEIQGSYFSIERARGKVGIVGLGLGYVAQEMAKRDEVKEIIVYEVSKDVIDLYNSNFKKNPKIKIINIDAFKAEPEEFDYFYADIYEYKITSDVVKDYEAFNKLHKIEEYSFFGMEHFLLSCSYEEIVWVYIPENWLAMAREAYDALEQSELLDYYKPLNNDIVSAVLQKFKVVLE